MTKIDRFLLTEYGKVFIDEIQINKLKNEILPLFVKNLDMFIFLDEESATFFIGDFDEVSGKILKCVMAGEYTKDDMFDLVAEEQVKVLKEYTDLTHQEIHEIVFSKMKMANLDNK